MKTLYVSDLDGTLLQSDETLSLYTKQTLDSLVQQGMLFSYATARSYNTARKVTKGLDAKIPLIVYNGTFVIDNQNQEILLSHYFSHDEVFALLDDLIAHQIYPIVYAYIDGVERFSYLPQYLTPGQKTFIKSRKGDSRDHPITHIEDLYQGNIFYISCIDDTKKLEPFYHQYQHIFHCIFQKDVYTHDQWLEFLPKQASKAQAILQLKSYLQCDKVVVFGDGKNDIDMFEIADESYAVKNAVPELKAIATGIIDDNNHDGVVKWLKQHFK